MAEKKVSTSFQVRAAPKSWSKYTTIYHQCLRSEHLHNYMGSKQILGQNLNYFENLEFTKQIKTPEKCLSEQEDLLHRKIKANNSKATSQKAINTKI